MGSAVGVTLLGAGVFLFWSAWVDTSPLAELRAALGGGPAPRRGSRFEGEKDPDLPKRGSRYEGEKEVF